MSRVCTRQRLVRRHIHPSHTRAAPVVNFVTDSLIFIQFLASQRNSDPAKHHDAACVVRGAPRCTILLQSVPLMIGMNQFRAEVVAVEIISTHFIK